MQQLSTDLHHTRHGQLRLMTGLLQLSNCVVQLLNFAQQPTQQDTIEHKLHNDEDNDDRMQLC